MVINHLLNGMILQVAYQSIPVLIHFVNLLIIYKSYMIVNQDESILVLSKDYIFHYLIIIGQRIIYFITL